MPKLDHYPKDSIYLVANDMDDYERVKQRWETWGWVLSADFKDNIYEVVAMKDSKIIVLLYELPKEKEYAPETTLE